MAADDRREPALAVVLVNYNDRAHLLEALAAVGAGAPDPDREIVVVDNASTDGSAELAAERYPGVRIIRNAANLGFSKANNIGLRATRGRHVLFMNTDAAPDPGCLETLLLVMAADASIGATGPALRLPSGAWQVSWGRRPTFGSELLAKALGNRIRARRLVRLRKGPAAARETDWISGAFLLTKREAVAAAGGFDEGFFLYFEDIDLCLRLKERGGRVVFVPGAAGIHAGGATTAPRKLRSRFEYRRSQLLFYRRHGSRTSRMLLRAYLRASFAALSLAGVIGRRSDPPRSEFLALLGKG